MARVIEHVGLVGGDDMPFDLVREPAVIVVPLRHVGGLRAHLGVELAVVAHLDLGEGFRLVADQVAELAQQRAAPRGVELWPFARGERLVRRAHRPVRVLRRAPGNQRPGLAREGVIARECLPGGGFDPLATDEHLVSGEVAGWSVHGAISTFTA